MIYYCLKMLQRFKYARLLLVAKEKILYKLASWTDILFFFSVGMRMQWNQMGWRYRIQHWIQNLQKYTTKLIFVGRKRFLTGELFIFSYLFFSCVIDYLLFSDERANCFRRKYKKQGSGNCYIAEGPTCTRFFFFSSDTFM